MNSYPDPGSTGQVSLSALAKRWDERPKGPTHLRVSDVRAMIGVSYGEFRILLETGQFPRANGEVGSSAVWRLSTVQRYLQDKGETAQLAGPESLPELRICDPALLGGRVLKLVPKLAVALGSVTKALLLQQYRYWANGGARTLRKSYSRLHNALPFISLRTVKSSVGELERSGLIVIKRSAGVNLTSVNIEAMDALMGEGDSSRAQLVFPLLAKVIGLNEAIAIQQIHLRHHRYDGSVWVLRSFDQLADEVFPYWSVATVKRIIARLARQNLIFLGKYHREIQTINRYRVNYAALMETGRFALSEMGPPGPYKEPWTHPALPFGPRVRVSAD